MTGFKMLLCFSASCHLYSEHSPTAGGLVTTEDKALEWRRGRVKDKVTAMGCPEDDQK